MKLIDKSAVIAEIERIMDEQQEICKADVALGKAPDSKNIEVIYQFQQFTKFLDTLEVKEVNLTDRKTEWPPSKKQMESLKDMLKYNIGVFDYQKFMEVNSLYEDLTKILDYETDRQK